MKLIQRSLVAILIFSLVHLPLPALAQSDPCSGGITGKSNAELQQDLDACNAEIAKWTDILNNTKQNTANYANEVAKLTARINAAKATIKAKSIAIAALNSHISEKQQKITTLEGQIDADHQSIADLVRKTNEIDDFTIAEAVLSGDDLSQFFADVDSFSSTRTSLLALVDDLRGVKSQTETEKTELAKQRDAEAEAKAAIEANKRQVEQSQAEQKTLLTQSQNQERAYGQLLAEKQARAAAIRAALFNLRDTAAIPFGTAYQYALEAQKVTGVDPAFLLAIITQESNLGQNVGSCYLTNVVTGDGIGANTGIFKPRVMNPSRDVPIFQEILGNVGGTLVDTRVSCWQPIYSSRGLPIGWGGGMGPAQFIPSTWRLFMARIESGNGGRYPNPWNAQDAFLASSMYLADLGASVNTYAAKRTAACKYYSGSSCATSYAAGYGNQVMVRAASIQTNMIDPLQGV